MTERRISRSRMREFQSGLAERLRQARATPGAHTMLAVRIAERDYLIDLPEAGEIVSVPEITPVPLTRAWFHGVSNLRGNLVSVIDLAHYGGQAPMRIDKESRLLTLGEELRFNAGILVSRMLGLRNVGHLRKLPGGASQLPWIGHALSDVEGRVWLPLSLARLVREDQFLQVGP